MVQDYGLNLLVRQETIESIISEEQLLKNALIAHGVKPHLVYPDKFTAPEAEALDISDEEALFQEDTAYDYSGVAPEDPADYERDLALMLGSEMDNDHELVSMNGGEWM